MALPNIFNTSALKVLGSLPVDGEVFDSIDDLFKYLQQLSDDGGYTIKKLLQNPPSSRLSNRKPYPNYVLYGCSKSRSFVKHSSQVDESKQRKRSSSKKTNCGYKVKAIRVDQEAEACPRWRLHVVEGMHNHDPYLAISADAANRLIRQPKEVLNEIDRLNQAGKP